MMNSVHFIGIGGIGMSGLARILLQKGVKVSGSDAHLNELTRELLTLGAVLFEGHKEENVPVGATVVYTSQVNSNNPEIIAAQKKGNLLMHRSELLVKLSEEKKVLAVTGTHGKTTTTSLLTFALTQNQWNPPYAVGGIISNLKTNASWGNGEYFIIEADESDGSFLRYTPYGAIVTNIDDDHLDHYGSLNELIKAFEKFTNQVQNKNFLVFCGDNPYLSALNCEGESYGLQPQNEWKIRNLRQKEWYIYFDLHHKNQIYKDIKVSLIGEHNAYNAAAVFVLCINLGISEFSLRKSFEQFSGVNRRAEKKGLVKDILLIDDYGHHPTEIKTTLEAIRKAEPKRRLIVVFQPHRYSRTQQCLTAYGTAFKSADVLVITDIYGAFENAIPGIDAPLVLNEVQNNCSSLSSRYIPRYELSKKLLQILQPNDAIITLGAGDITKIGPELLKSLESNGK